MAVLANVGVAVAAPGMTTSDLLRDADIAMCEAERAAKSQIKIFDPAMRLSTTRQLEFRGELGHAGERKQMRLMFQPMVNLTTGKVIGAEALIRCNHPIHGEIPPVDRVRAALATHQLDPGMVMLEIDETMFVEQVESSRNSETRLGVLRSRG